MKVAIAFLLVVTFALAGQRTYAQKQGRTLVDSLFKELHKAKEDTNKVKLFNAIAYTYLNINLDSGMIYAEDGLKLAQATKWEKGQAACYHTIGINFRYKAQYSEAMAYHFKALKLYEEIGDKDGRAAVLGQIGVIFQFQKDCDKALKFEQQSLKIYEELGNKNAIADQLGDIATVYCLKTQFDTAITYEFKSLDIYNSIGDAADVARTYGNIGYVYDEAGNFVKALEYSFNALKGYREGGDMRSVGIEYNNIGDIYLKIAKKTPSFEPNQLIPKRKTDILNRAKLYLDSSIIISKKCEDLDPMQESYQQLSSVNALLGDYKSAYEYYQQYIVIRDSVFSTENKIIIANIDAKHEMELKEKQIEIDKLDIAKKHNERWFFMAAIFFLTIIGLLFINRQRLQQKKLEADKKNAEMEKAVAESDLAAAQKQLDMFRQSIQEKNTLIEQFSNGLATSGGDNLKPDIAMITQLERSIILTDQQWENFKELFEKVHKGFFARLRTKLPDLTQAEVRFLTLTKLNLSPKEMASMLGISPNAIRMYRYRLRKKLELDKEEMIEELIHGL